MLIASWVEIVRLKAFIAEREYMDTVDIMGYASIIIMAVVGIVYTVASVIIEIKRWK